MSSAQLSASGARSLTSTVNDPAVTRASMPTKGGDSISVTVGSVEEFRMVLPATTRIEKREYVSTRQVDGEQKEVKTTYHVLVVPSSSVTAFLRAGETMWPHITVDLKDWSKEKAGYHSGSGKHFTESGELAETFTMVGLGIAEEYEHDDPFNAGEKQTSVRWPADTEQS